MAKRICSVEGCDSPSRTHGLCVAHYQREKRWGDPLGRRPTIEERLFANSEWEGGCLVWTGRVGHAGYGVTFYKGKDRRVNRISYELFVGPIPEGLHVLHSCDNPPCWLPKHLRTGTVAENMEDREKRGRGVRLRGSMHGQARLTEQDVHLIRKLLGHRSYASIAAQFGVSISAIGGIATRRTWAWLKTPIDAS